MATPEELQQQQLLDLSESITRQAAEIFRIRTTLGEATTAYNDAGATITRYEALINIITHDNATLNIRVQSLRASSVPAGGRDRDSVSRITKTDLLKSKEIQAFSPKANFETLVDHFKNNLYAKSATTLTAALVQSELNVPTDFRFTAESAGLIDGKIVSTLSNLTRDHPIVLSRL